MRFLTRYNVSARAIAALRRASFGSAGVNDEIASSHS